MNSKLYRMGDLLNPADRHSLVVDTSNGLVLGVLPGLENFTEAVNTLLPLMDGIVTSPGQARKLASRTRQEAALLIRADWTNALRGKEFVLPPEINPIYSSAEPYGRLGSGLKCTGDVLYPRARRGN